MQKKHWASVVFGSLQNAWHWCPSNFRRKYIVHLQPPLNVHIYLYIIWIIYIYPLPKKNDLSPKDVAHLIPLQSHPGPSAQHKWELPTHLPQWKTMLPRSSEIPTFERPHNTKPFGHFRNQENLEMTTRKAAVGNFRNYLWNRCFFRNNGV